MEPTAGTAPRCEFDTTTSEVELMWIPLGSGQRVVRASGRVFEAFSSRLQHRPACALYHSALMVTTPAGRHAIEVAPIPRADGSRRGVVAEGAVGSQLLRRLRVFRYEVRCWRGGSIPDAAAAVTSTTIPVEVETAQRVIDTLPSIPTPVWGRDELGTGEMWNSNSVVSWVLVRSGIDVADLGPPAGGRAPGWEAGIAVAVQPEG